jgi:hypothetical protein
MPGAQRLTRTQEKAIAALLAERTIQGAAARAKISERTLAYWLRRPDFAAEYRARRQQIIEHVVGIMQASSMKALEALERNTSCGKASVEVQAAGKILEHALGAVELFDLAQRVSELEQTIKSQGVGHENRSTSANGRAHNGPSR